MQLLTTQLMTQHKQTSEQLKITHSRQKLFLLLLLLDISFQPKPSLQDKHVQGVTIQAVQILLYKIEALHPLRHIFRRYKALKEANRKNKLAALTIALSSIKRK